MYMEESKAVVKDSITALGMVNVAEINVYAMKDGLHRPIRMAQMHYMLLLTALQEIVHQVLIIIS